jgi:ATP-dependent Zn protease
MSFADDRLPMPPAFRQRNDSLAGQWRWLTRAATLMALVTAPAFFLLLYQAEGWGLGWSILVTFFAVVAFRGLVDVIVRKIIPWPSLFGAEQSLQQEDIVARRRVWFWRKFFRRVLWLAGIFFFIVLLIYLPKLWWSDQPITFVDAMKDIPQFFADNADTLLSLALQLPLFFLINLLIFIGPLMFFSIKQIQAFEPGDADWGVQMEDVRGQDEAKEEVSRVVALWQSGEAFEAAGGKRERGLLFLGAPGTGKTMLSKAIATNFNCPFVTIPGSGFAQMFLGMDALVVRYLAYRARKLAAKWGGQCIVFIDEIDAVGMRRNTLGGGAFSTTEHRVESIHDVCFFGPNGTLTPDGDLLLETRAWREKMFAARKEAPARVYPNPAARIGEGLRRFFYGGMGGGMGQQSLQQLLVVMDGVDNPPWLRKTLTTKLNTWMDACYVFPQRIRKVPLRLPRAKPASEQIYFIGACNVPLEVLDPALTRPGRMGRHVWFRTPTKDDRKDVFDRYLGKVAHEDDLDSDRRRDELARITHGYSPAMIEQVCSMALTYAHHDGRERFGWGDIVEAMTTVESGTAVRVEYIPEETRATAIHEAGHAAAAHVYMKGVLSTRLSIRKRGASQGHHQAIETQERFSKWRHEQVADLIWTLGAMAAERVFYGENTNGVGGDVMSATAQAAVMVGMSAMAPERVDLSGRFATEEEEDEAREKLMKRFERIGAQILRRSGGGSMMQQDPIAGVLSDPWKRAAAAQLLGQAYITAHWFIEANREAVEQIAETLIERREMHGDEVVELLDRVHLKVPEVDVLDYSRWPKL